MFFDAYSSDFASMYFWDESILYADGIVHVFVGTSLEEVTDHVNNRLNSNQKSDFTIVTNKRLKAQLHLFIGSDLIKKITSFKYLGVHIDTRLKYNV